METRLPLNLTLAVFAYLPVDEVVYGSCRQTCRYLQQCTDAYVCQLKELVVRPGFYVKTVTATRLQSLIIEPQIESATLDNSLRRLLGNGSTLKRITFHSGSLISSSTLEILQEGCPAVMSIAMPSCNLTNAQLRIVSRFRNLQQLDLSGCYRLTDAGIRHLSRGCSRLQVLILSGCPNISDRALEMLTDHCPLSPSPRSSDRRPFEHLQTLDLSETSITDSGVDLVRSRCPHIEQFVADYCYRVSGYARLYESIATNFKQGSAA